MFTQYLVIELPCKKVTHLNKLYMLLEENANYEQYVYITYNVCTCKLTYVECKCNWKLNPIKLTGTDAIWYKKTLVILYQNSKCITNTVFLNTIMMTVNSDRHLC